MSQTAIVFPLAAQAVMSMLLLLLLGPARARSLGEQKLGLEDPAVRLGQISWSAKATQIANNYKNQFELPVLFYAVGVLALVLKLVDPLLLGLAWTFTLTRLGHAIVHVGSNVIIWRATFFIVGAVALLAMWLILVWRVWIGA